jgi:putative SOS response-associated peptidase YedK
MCGCYVLASSTDELRRTFGFAEVSDLPRQLRPRFNVAPTQVVPVVREPPARKLDIVRAVGGERELVAARWGLVPSRMLLANSR